MISNPTLVKKVYEISKYFIILLLIIFILETLLTYAGISSKIDDTGVSVGKRYARTDECGIPYALTIDFETLEDNSITMRELSTMK